METIGFFGSWARGEADEKSDVDTAVVLKNENKACIKRLKMKTIQAVIDIPEDLYLSLSCFGLTKERIVSESKKLLALKYFQEKLLSLGKATELSGLSKWDFIEFLSSNNVSVIDYDEDEMNRELKTAEKLSVELTS